MDFSFARIVICGDINELDRYLELVKNGERNINTKNNNDYTLLHYACNFRKTSLELITKLINNGAIVEIADIKEAILNINDLSIIELLIDKIDNINLVYGHYNLLHAAVISDKVDVVGLLLEKGVDPFIKDAFDKYPINLTDNVEIKELLQSYMTLMIKEPE